MCCFWNEFERSQEKHKMVSFGAAMVLLALVERRQVSSVVMTNSWVELKIRFGIMCYDELEEGKAKGSCA